MELSALQNHRANRACKPDNHPSGVMASSGAAPAIGTISRGLSSNQCPWMGPPVVIREALSEQDVEQFRKLTREYIDYLAEDLAFQV